MNNVQCSNILLNLKKISIVHFFLSLTTRTTFSFLHICRQMKILPSNGWKSKRCKVVQQEHLVGMCAKMYTWTIEPGRLFLCEGFVGQRRLWGGT